MATVIRYRNYNISVEYNKTEQNPSFFIKSRPLNVFIKN